MSYTEVQLRAENMLSRVEAKVYKFNREIDRIRARFKDVRSNDDYYDLLEILLEISDAIDPLIN